MSDASAVSYISGQAGRHGPQRASSRQRARIPAGRGTPPPKTHLVARLAELRKVGVVHVEVGAQVAREGDLRARGGRDCGGCVGSASARR